VGQTFASATLVSPTARANWHRTDRGTGPQRKGTFFCHSLHSLLRASVTPCEIGMSSKVAAASETFGILVLGLGQVLSQEFAGGAVGGLDVLQIGAGQAVLGAGDGEKLVLDVVLFELGGH